MKRIAQYLSYVLLVLAYGCAALGIPQPTTFNQKIAVAYTTVSEVRGVAGSLVAAGKITPDDAQNIQNQANNARDGIEIARKAYTGGDSPTATSRLAAVQTILTALQAYLKGKS